MSTTQTQANKELVEEYLEVLQNQERDRIPEFYADDFTVDMMQFDEGTTETGGVEELIDAIEDVWEGFPDATNEVKEMAADGDWVLYRVKITGTHEGEFKGIEPTGKEVEWQYHGSLRIEDGAFVEAHGTMSTGWLLAQLGVDIPLED